MGQLAWVGLGNMGQGMARNLIQKGNLDNPLILYNRSPSRTENLAKEAGEGKASVAKTLTEAITAADIIFTSLANDDAIRYTMGEALKTDVAGKIFVDCTTVHPDVTNELASTAASKGAKFASMTVLGSPFIAAAGQLICILSGPGEAVDSVMSYTTGVMGRTTIKFRDEPAGKADLLKLIANTFILNVNEVVAEGLTFAEKAAIEPRKLQELLAGLFGGVYSTYSERMVSGDYHGKDPQVPIDMALKDAHHAQAIAADVECALPSLATAEKHLQAVKARRGASADSSAVYGVNRLLNGLTFEN